MILKNSISSVQSLALNQSIEVPVRTPCYSSTIIDHILASSPYRVTQQGVIVWDSLITSLFNALEKSPESKEYTQKIEMPFATKLFS